MLGQPVKTLKPPMTAASQSCIYYLDDVTTARFDVMQDEIQTVFLSK